MNVTPRTPFRIRSASANPDAVPRGRSTWVRSPVITIRLPSPNRVRNIFICMVVAFCASSSTMKAFEQSEPHSCNIDIGNVGNDPASIAAACSEIRKNFDNAAKLADLRLDVGRACYENGNKGPMGNSDFGHQFAWCSVHQAMQRCVTQAQCVTPTGLDEVGKADTARRAVEIGDVALEPDGPRLTLAHAQVLARRLALELHQGIGSRVGKTRHPVSPSDMNEVALDRRRCARRHVRGVDPGERADPGRHIRRRGFTRGHAVLAAPPIPQGQVRAKRPPCVARPTPHGGVEQRGVDGLTTADQRTHVSDEIDRLAAQRNN